jgi:hypothetical protein
MALCQQMLHSGNQSFFQTRRERGRGFFKLIKEGDGLL